MRSDKIRAYEYINPRIFSCPSYFYLGSCLLAAKMFLVISHELFPQQLLRCFVSKYGDIFFRAVDVAEMLGVNNPKRWAKKFCKTQVSDIIKKTGTVLNIRKWLYKTRVFSMKETAFLLTHFPNSPPFAQLMGHKLERRGAYARVWRNPAREEPHHYMMFAPRVVITLPREKEEKSKYLKVDTLRNFLNDFSSKCVSYYIQQEEAYKEKIKNTEWLLKVSPKRGFEHPPRLMTMEIGDNSFQYILV